MNEAYLKFLDSLSIEQMHALSELFISAGLAIVEHAEECENELEQYAEEHYATDIHYIGA